MRNDLNFESDEDEDDFDEFKKWLETLNISQLQEVYYQQACEITRIRDIILDSVKKTGIKKLSVISGVGVREYYRKLGYKLERTYMTKKLD